MKKRIITILLVVSVIAVIGFRLASNKAEIDKNNQVIDRSSIAIPVTVTPASLRPAAGGFSLPAEVEPINEADITLNSTGKLALLQFDLGSSVRKGQSLGQVDVTQLQLNLKATQLLIDKAERDYKNFKELYEANAASENDFKNAEYTYENAKAQAAQIKQQIADATLKAPITGVVIDKTVEEGEFVAAGRAVGTIVDISRLKVVMKASESDVYRIQEGMEVTLTSEVYPRVEFSGKVAFVSPQGDKNHNYKVEVVTDNKEEYPLKAGTFVRVHFQPEQGKELLSIPKSALVEGLRNPYVYVVQQGKAAVRQLLLGKESGEYIEVVSGLKKGEEVILSGQINLVEGSPIKIISAK